MALDNATLAALDLAHQNAIAATDSKKALIASKEAEISALQAKIKANDDRLAIIIPQWQGLAAVEPKNKNIMLQLTNLGMEGDKFRNQNNQFNVQIGTLNSQLATLKSDLVLLEAAQQTAKEVWEDYKRLNMSAAELADYAEIAVNASGEAKKRNTTTYIIIGVVIFVVIIIAGWLIFKYVGKVPVPPVPKVV